METDVSTNSDGNRTRPGSDGKTVVGTGSGTSVRNRTSRCVLCRTLVRNCTAVLRAEKYDQESGPFLTLSRISARHRTHILQQQPPGVPPSSQGGPLFPCLCQSASWAGSCEGSCFLPGGSNFTNRHRAKRITYLPGTGWFSR